MVEVLEGMIVMFSVFLQIVPFFEDVGIKNILTKISSMTSMSTPP